MFNVPKSEDISSNPRVTFENVKAVKEYKVDPERLQRSTKLERMAWVKEYNGEGKSLKKYPIETKIPGDIPEHPQIILKLNLLKGVPRKEKNEI